MRSPWLVATVLVALGAMFYALLRLGGLGTQAPVASEEPRRDPVRRAPAPQGHGGIKPAEVTQSGDARPRGGPPPRPEPSLDLEQARRDYADVIAEIEGIAGQGRRVDSQAWVELYRRGNEALTQLQMHLDWADPAHADELRDAPARLRRALGTIESRPETP